MPKKRSEELIDPGRDGVGEQVVIERVPLPEPLQSDLQIVLATARLPGQNLLRERMQAGRGLARTDGSEDGHSCVQSPLRDGDRMMDFPDHDSGAGIAGLQGPLGPLAKREQIAVAVLEPDPPDCDEKQPADQDSDGGRGAVSADDPAVEVGGVIENQVERRIVAGHGERPVEETPYRAAQPARDQDRIAHFHGACLRRVSARLGYVFGTFP